METQVITTENEPITTKVSQTGTFDKCEAEQLLIAPHSHRNKVRIEAHRGFGRYEPENTLQAFARAVDEKLDGIELDVWLSKDGIPVVIHTGSYEEEGYIAFDDGTQELVYEMTFKQIRSKKILKGHLIPTLDEVLRLARKKICVNIEFKGEDLTSAVRSLECVKETDTLEQVQFSSFNWKFYEALQSARKELGIEKYIPFSFLIWEPEVLESGNPFIGQAGDGITLEWTLFETHSDLVKSAAEEALRKGYKFKIYFPFSHIEDFEVYETLEKLGVDTAITNEPYLMNEFYQQENH